MLVRNLCDEFRHRSEVVGFEPQRPNRIIFVCIETSADKYQLRFDSVSKIIEFVFESS